MDIIERLFALQDIKYAEFQRPLLPNLPPERIIGVRTPMLRKLAGELSGTSEAEAFLAVLPHRYFDENQLHAFLVSLENDFASCLAAVEGFLPFVDNWATCDQLSPRAFARNADALLPSVRRWMAAEHEYTCRFGIGRLMAHFLDDRFNEEHLQWVAGIHRDEYYIKMMQAWYFATALAKQWGAALPYMQKGRVGEWVRRKSIQKAVESFRVSDEHKNLLRSLR